MIQLVLHTRASLLKIEFFLLAKVLRTQGHAVMKTDTNKAHVIHIA